MSNTQLRVLAVALAALLALWGATRLFTRGSDVVRGSLELPRLGAGDADSLVIAHRADTVRLVRQGPGRGWSVNGHPAASAAVSDFFHALGDSTRPDLAAASPSSFTRMGVDSEGGWKLQVASHGRWALDLVIGNAGSEYGTGYLRRNGTDSVYLWRGQLPDLVRRDSEAWRDHRIAAVEPDSVRAIVVERGGRRYGLRAIGHTWRFDTGAPADSAQVAGLLGRFRALMADGFATEAQVDSLRSRHSRRRVTLRGSGAAPLIALSFDSTAAGFWARRDGDATVYRIDTWRINDLTPADSTLRPARPAATPQR